MEMTRGSVLGVRGVANGWLVSWLFVMTVI